MKLTSKLLVSAVVLSTVSFGAYAKVNACENQSFSDITVKSFAYQALLASNTFNHKNYQANMTEASKYFSTTAWNSFKADQAKKGIPQRVANEQLAASMGVENSPVATKSANNSWQVKMPLVMHYKSNQGQSEQNVVATLNIAPSSNAKTNCLQIKSVSLANSKNVASNNQSQNQKPVQVSENGPQNDPMMYVHIVR